MTADQSVPVGSYRALHDNWTLTAHEPPVRLPAQIAARVPGCVHTDLLASDATPDPYLDENELEVAWIGRTDWTYETVFSWHDDGAERVDLVCDGLDTVAEVRLNGELVGQAANMHRAYRFAVREVMRPGENRLTVRFFSALRYAEQLREELGDRPGAYSEPYNFIRKMACNFGWDWGPTLVTAGIWRPIGLHAWSGARLAAVRPLATVDDSVGRVSVHVDVARAGAPEVPVTVTARLGTSEARTVLPAGTTDTVVELTVDQPELWWPRGYGAQPLYPLDVTVSTVDGATLDTWSRRIGFRTIDIDTSPDADGSAFRIVVNGTPVFARGANWIPDDCFPSQVDRDRYAARLAQACDANINLLRVWGGGIYESDDFYDLCDELGLLVWQDFLFACAAYPEEPPLAAEVAAEAREAVIRLAPHPSLAVWCGNNENIWGWYDWGWQEPLAGRTWGAGYYYELLPRIVAELDSTRPYWPGSPYSGAPDRTPNDDAHGTSHVWDVWNERDYTAYRDRVPRFVAEFGYQGPPTHATLTRAIHDEPLTPDSPGMRHHQKAVNGNAKLEAGLTPRFRTPRSFDDWHYLTQVNQARAIELGVTHFRSHQPRCMGTVVWQLNDCWPVTSWAAVDGDGRLKPLWYALRRAYADRLVTIQPREGQLVLAAVNDTAATWQASVPVIRYGLDGRPLASVEIDVSVPPRTARTWPLPDAVAFPGDPAHELIAAGEPASRAWWWFAEDRDIAYPAADLGCVVEPHPDGQLVTVTARTVLRDLGLFADRLDPAARVDDMLVTLLPGDSVTFRVTSARPLDPTALTAAPVLRCVNDDGAR